MKPESPSPRPPSQVAEPSPKHVPTIKISAPTNGTLIDAHVVILNNYLRPHHVVAYTELSKRVRQLTILLSVDMEPDRDWKAEWKDLNVRLQKNWTLTRTWRHSSGFAEPNFIHLPIDTMSQLKSLQPDIVFSYEMGIRTLLASRYCRTKPDTPLIMVGNMSEHIERERGWLRRQLRKLICRNVDAFTYNGPSCRRYLSSLSIADHQLFPLPYCIDPEVVNLDPRQPPTGTPTKLLYCGALSQRKGVLRLTTLLQRYCQSNSGQQVQLSLAGTGPDEQALLNLQTGNFTIKLLGNCDPAQLRTAYGQTDICVFPTLADEWGLVPVESLASGVPVLGSKYAQSVEACVQTGVNGWIHDPNDDQDTYQAIGRALSCPPHQLVAMQKTARQSVRSISPEATADAFCNIIRSFRTGS